MIGDFSRSIMRVFRARAHAIVRIVVLLPVAVASISLSGVVRTDATPATFMNPLVIQPTAVGAFESCPDPAIIRSQQSDDPSWYMYCTTNPLNGTDRNTSG